MATSDLIRRLLEEGDARDLGCLSSDELAAAVADHSTEVEGARLFVVLAEHPRTEATTKALVALAGNADVLAMMEIASWLGRGGQVPSSHRQGLGKAFLGRAADRSVDYGTRSQALKAAMIMAQSERSLLRRLQADILDLDPSDDGIYLRHAARVAGAVLAHEPADDLRHKLTELADVEEAEDEAAVELGLDALRTGLGATKPETALDAFGQARYWFARAEDATETRLDARLYVNCLDMLVAFQEGRTGEDLPDRIDTVTRSAFEYTAFLTLNDREPETASWLAAKDLERVHWTSLALRLGAVAEKVSRSAWLKVAAVMEEELLSVYAASRTMFRRGSDGGLEQVVRPRIVGAMQRELRSLDILEHWIEENAGSAYLADAKSLGDLVRQAREDLVTHRPSGAADGSSPTAAIIEHLPATVRDTVSARIEADAISLLDETVSRTVDDVLARATAALMTNVDYRERADARRFFDILLLDVTRFVVSRYNLSTATFPGVAYLFNRDAKNPPLEADLQYDFVNSLMGSRLAEICRPEARDLGGGRVDVLFSYRWMRTTSELKRSFPKLTSGELVDRYGPQAISYQGTNVALSMLMVLDLFDRSGAQPDIRDQIGVHHRTVADSSVETAVVLFRIQGKRHTPSDIPKSALTPSRASQASGK
ncbi:MULTISPECIES: hypothetical protein [Methylobacterium]|uniref:Uncharacterized protein n=2 Tax=Methylobacterium TaxID=407 RepID=A0AA37HCH8_9HYPH|nr:MULTISPECIES: hypothetical protein [Methylobacterium]TGD97917.1 hypothetical protein EU555_17255 [Methylobacterium nonmethylotrophicum]GJD63410.1 hypothetical protein MPEAHAMD_3578 [Methylobacterium frigidaeris]